MQRTARPGDSMLVVLPKLTEQSRCHAILKKIVLARITHLDSQRLQIF